MTQAITRCPACQTSFRVTESQLAAAEGAVRCGACLHVFQADQYLVSPLLDVTERLGIEQDYWSDFETWLYQVTGYENPQKSAEADAAIPIYNPDEFTAADSERSPLDEEESADEYLDEYEVEAAQSETDDFEFDITEIPVLEDKSIEETARYEALYEEMAFHESKADERDLEGAEVSRQEEAIDLNPFDGMLYEIEGAPDASEINLDVTSDHPVILQEKRQFMTLRVLSWVPALLVTLILGFVQFSYFNMSKFSQQPEYRPYYLEICRYLFCDVPEYSSKEELTTRELVIRSHPEHEGALVADVLLLNAADFRQVFPDLHLRFLSVAGEVVASRVFSGDEYLGGELRGLRFIPARTEVRLSLEIIDPGRDALGYEMSVVSSGSM